ncbi:MAG: hypothetical protein ACFFFH_18150 [Candidatus Thorarchaeota archaeon]
MNPRKTLQWGGSSLLFLFFVISLNLHCIILNPISYQALSHSGNERRLSGGEMISGYTPDFTGNGKDCNVTLQQTLVDSSPITVSNTSDPLNNSFYEPCPTTENFPSSFVNMTLEDIYAPNKTMIIEDGPADDITDELMTKAYLTSFTTNSSCFLTNASFELSISGSPIVHVYFYNSTWNSTMSRTEPDIRSETILTSMIPTVTGWHEFDLLDTFLNNSMTKNNTWFIGLYRSGGAGTARWRFKYTGPDNSEAYSYDGLYLTHLTDHLLCKMGLAPYISPPNQTLIVEDGTNNGLELLSGNPETTSFRIQGNGYLENVSVYLRNQVTYGATIRIDLFNSEWNRTELKSQPVNGPLGFQLGLFTIEASSEGWMSVTNIHKYLNISNTENNTWFIAVFKSGQGTPTWMFTRDDVNGDNSESYFYNTTDHKWQLRQDGFGRTRDYHLRVDLSLIENIPSKIGLKINDIPVTGHPKLYRAGFWLSTDQYSNPLGNLNFILTADWWDVSCTITFVQLVYTKTDVKATSTFTVGSNQKALWNITDNEGLNYLDPRINETAIINFTIPSSWNNINVFNGTLNRTDGLLVRVLNNGYSEICVLNSGSGYWYLTASSENLLNSLDSYVDSIPVSVLNNSDVVTFNVSFKETVFQDDGLINLSIYSPVLINEVLNYTIAKSTFSTSQEIALGDWDVYDTVTQYGVFRVQVSWYNGTAVGFLEVNLTVIGESDLILIEPPQNSLCEPDQQFTIIVYYEDTHLHKAIEDATINFNIANQGWEVTTLTNGTIGYYLIPVDCSELSSSGPKYVEITATREFYSTQALEYMFEISEITSKTSTSTSTGTTTTTTTTMITEAGTFPGGLTVLVVLGTLVIFIRRQKKLL